MDPAVALAVAQLTREQAVLDARNDLWELRYRAVEAGRERSREITKTSRIDPRTGEIRYNPAGRLLRDWYFHVYLNTLRANLGDPAVVVDAQQVEDTAGILRRLRGADGLVALRVVAVIRDTAIDDAAQAASRIVDHLTGVAMRRAILHAPDDRFAGDQLAIHVTRHWYQHCYDDHIHGATRSRHPLAEVTDAQSSEVADALAAGQARLLIGADGLPLVTAHGTIMSQLDRDLATGHAGLVPPISSDSEQGGDLTGTLRQQVTSTWAALGDADRVHWLRAVGVPRPPIHISWDALTGELQTRIIGLYLDTHQSGQIAVPFQAEPIPGDPRQAAMRMFGHRQHLSTADLPAATADTPTVPSDHSGVAPAEVHSQRLTS